MSVKEVSQDKTDRRVLRNRKAILLSMVELVGEKRWADITVGDIVNRADVARSTFYKHFAGKEDVLLASMHPMLQILARLRGDLAWRSDLDRLLQHFWASRSFARVVFGSERAWTVERALRDEILISMNENGLTVRNQMIAIRVAAGRIALIREWVKGEFSAQSQMVADLIAECQ